MRITSTLFAPTINHIETAQSSVHFSLMLPSRSYIDVQNDIVYRVSSFLNAHTQSLTNKESSTAFDKTKNLIYYHIELVFFCFVLHELAFSARDSGRIEIPCELFLYMNCSGIYELPRSYNKYTHIQYVQPICSLLMPKS